MAQRAGGQLGQGQPAQAGDQLQPHLRVAQFSEQAPGQRQVHHDPGRQQPKPPLYAAGRGKNLIDHLERYETGQLTQMTRREHARGTVTVRAMAV
jgi:hypothetical protein